MPRVFEFPAAPETKVRATDDTIWEATGDPMGLNWYGDNWLSNEGHILPWPSLLMSRGPLTEVVE